METCSIQDLSKTLAKPENGDAIIEQAVTSVKEKQLVRLLRHRSRV